MAKLIFTRKSASALLQDISAKLLRENPEVTMHLVLGKPVRITIETIEEE